MLLPIPGPLVSFTQYRALHTSVGLLGKRNFRKFLMGTKAGTLAFKKERAQDISFRKKFPDIDIPGKLSTFRLSYWHVNSRCYPCK